MAACVLCRRLPELRYLPGLRGAFSQGRHTHVKPEGKTDDQEEKKGVLQHQEASIQGGYRLHYNPSSYHHHSLQNSAFSCDQTDEEELRLSANAPSVWQQSNRYSMSCLRHLSTSKNTLLDIAFIKGSEPETPSVSSSHRQPVPTHVRVDSRAFLRCRPEYASSTLDLTQRPTPIEWEKVLLVLQKVTVLKSSMKPSDVSQLLLELSRCHPDKMLLVRKDQRFLMLLQYSVNHLCLFTNLQLFEVLQSFVWLDMPSDHTVLKQYDAELSSRANQMSLHQLMFAADLWRCLGKKMPQFLRHLYDLVPLCLGQVGLPELVQLLYIMGEDRHFPKHLIRPLEQLLMCHLQQLHPEEVGAVCLGLFKSQTSLSEGAVTCIIDKGLSFVQELSDLAVVNMMKLLRFSYLSHMPWLEAMAHEVPRRAHGMGIIGLMHMALTCASLRYRNDSILIAIAETVPSLLSSSQSRIKDSCKLLWAYGTLGFLTVKSPNFYPSLTKALRQSRADFQKYPEHMLTGLLGLAFVSHFPEDLIALALSPDFVNLALKHKKVELKNDLFTLDGTVALELPHWTGPRLSSELREEVAELMWKFVQSNVCEKPELREAESALQDLLGGEQFVCKRMILPHTRSVDLEVHLDSTGQPIPVNPAPPEGRLSTFPTSEDLGRLNTGVTITEELLAQLIKNKNLTGPSAPSSRVKPTFFHGLEPDEGGRLFDTMLDLKGDITETLNIPSSQDSACQDFKGTVKVAVQVILRNHNCLYSKQPVGLHAMKRRQLKKAGFRIVELYREEWIPMMRKSRLEKLAYLHCKIHDSLS